MMRKFNFEEKARDRRATENDEMASHYGRLVKDRVHSCDISNEDDPDGEANSSRIDKPEIYT